MSALPVCETVYPSASKSAATVFAAPAVPLPLSTAMVNPVFVTTPGFAAVFVGEGVNDGFFAPVGVIDSVGAMVGCGVRVGTTTTSSYGSCCAPRSRIPIKVKRKRSRIKIATKRNPRGRLYDRFAYGENVSNPVSSIVRAGIIA